MKLLILLVPFGLALICASVAVSAESGLRVYIGTYNGAKSKGIYTARFDQATGKLSAPELAAETKNPSFLAVHPTGPFLYAVAEIDNFNGQHTGAVSAFRIEPETGKLTLLNQQASGGAGPCHLSVDKTGQCLLVANYGSGSIAALPIDKDGKLGTNATVIQHEGSSVNPTRQKGPHAHFITPDPANRFVLTCDLGLDKVLVYKFDPGKCSLAPNDPPSVSLNPGSGPRHLVFNPHRRVVFVANEIGSTLTAFDYDAERGVLEERQSISTLPVGFKGENSCAEIQILPSGRFVYVSNRGHDSIAVFSIDPRSGQLELVQDEPTQGKTPRHFALSPDGKWLLAENQDSGNIVVFAVDPRRGKLTPTGQKVEVGAPVCLVFAEK
jgi:6-phosphogluconolactonase